MIHLSTLPFRKRRGRRRRTPPPAPPAPAALTLTAATYDPAGPTVTLSFDRAIDVAGLVASQVTVDDAGDTGFSYAGTAVASQPTPQSVVVALAPAGSPEGPTVLNATASTGIVADDDGGTWAGVTDLELPFP